MILPIIVYLHENNEKLFLKKHRQSAYSMAVFNLALKMRLTQSFKQFMLQC